MPIVLGQETALKQPPSLAKRGRDHGRLVGWGIKRSSRMVLGSSQVQETKATHPVGWAPLSRVGTISME